MNKLQLPTVTLLIVDCLNVKRAEWVIDHCTKLCDFGSVRFLTSLPTESKYATQIMPLNSLIAYSIFMLTKSHEYIDTEHCLVVQRDGFILNTSAWDYNWLTYDYVAPLFVQYDHVGSGGFSLRSKRLMKATAQRIPKWNGTQKNAEKIQQGVLYYEDGVISFTELAKTHRLASLEDAANFCQGGNRNPLYYRPHPFGFHGAFQNINHETGFVHPVCNCTPPCQCAMPHLQFLKSLEH